MLPFLIFLLSLHPVQYQCSIYPGTGPTCTEFGYDPDKPNIHTYECHIVGTGDCTYYVGTSGSTCHCYQWKPEFQEILCPWSDCQGGKCKTCNLSDKPASGSTWGGVKQLYR
jgi:hypothetical protein